jgi:hypothetical protein
MLAARITLPHLSVSYAIKLLKSAEEPGNTVAPRRENCSCILESARAALISLLSFPMISDGVFWGRYSLPNAYLQARNELAHAWHVR